LPDDPALFLLPGSAKASAVKYAEIFNIEADPREETNSPKCTSGWPDYW
jgi:hypothetical protein